MGWKKTGFTLLIPWTVSIDYVAWFAINNNSDVTRVGNLKEGGQLVTFF